jgi:hypothetical protein
MLLPGCASTRSALDAKKPVELATPAAQPPGGLEQPCAAPVRLAGKPMSAGEVERHWGKDRVSLAECKGRHKAFADWRRIGAALERLFPARQRRRGPSGPDARPDLRRLEDDPRLGADIQGKGKAATRG